VNSAATGCTSSTQASFDAVAQPQPPSHQHRSQHHHRHQRLMDINICTLVQLQEIDGIGKVLAQRIIDARPISDWDGVKAIKGVGDTLLAAIQAKATIVITTSAVADENKDDSGDDYDDVDDESPEAATTSDTGTAAASPSKKPAKRQPRTPKKDADGNEIKSPPRRKKGYADLKPMSPEVKKLRDKHAHAATDAKQHIDIRTSPSGRGTVRIATWNVRNLSRHRGAELLAKMVNNNQLLLLSIVSTSDRTLNCCLNDNIGSCSKLL
jgi:hypothetical protein